MEPLTKAAAGRSDDWKTAALDNDAGPGTAIPEYVVRAAMQVRDYLDESGMTRLAGLRRQNAPVEGAETEWQTKRRMQDDGPERPLCHQRPFNPGDRVQYHDVDDNRMVGTLLTMEADRCWTVDVGGYAAPQLVHEDGLTLLEHARQGNGIDFRHQTWGSRRDFQVRGTGELWREATIIHADTIIRQGGLVHFAQAGRVYRTFVEADVEIRQLSDAGA
jgi:hypothetical protein